jgi:hypothetical protein
VTTQPADELGKDTAAARGTEAHAGKAVGFARILFFVYHAYEKIC